MILELAALASAGFLGYVAGRVVSAIVYRREFARWLRRARP